jgi:hypothetical protein
VLSGEAPPARQSPRRAARPLRAGLAALAVAAFLVACGDDEDSDGEAPSAAATELELVLDRDGPGGEQTESAQVSCEGAGDAACGLVDELPADPGAPVPPDVACTDIYGGPDLLTVTGTLEGDPIDAEFTRENGCEIDRFDRWVPLLRELFPGYRPGEAIAP